MGWSSLFAWRPSRRWIPVSNTDNMDDSDTDELMRMADGEYEITGSDTTTQAIHNSSHDDPVFQLRQPTNQQPSRLVFSSLISTDDSNMTENVSKTPCFCGPVKITFPQRKWYYILLSLFIILSFVSLTVGLGIYSLLFYYPDKLVIDKSVKSFSIPNHEAYRNFEAMMLARKNNATGKHRRDIQNSLNTGSRWKRDASDAIEKRMLKQTHSVLKNLRQEGVKFFSKKKNSRSQKTFSPSFSFVSTINKVLDRFKRSAQEIDCLLQYQSVARWKMHVIYLAHGDNDTNMFTRERLQTAHEIEKKIIEHPGFHKFCLRDPNMERYDPTVQKMNGCVPLNSLLTYFYPTKDPEGKVFYDGMGANIVDIDSALKLAMTQESFYFYVDDKINKTFQKSHLLRSEVLFGAPLLGYCVNDFKKDQDDKFKDFVVTYIQLLSKSSTDKVRVLYGGNEIFDYEVSTSFWSDVRLAIISLIAIFVLMLVLSLSLYLTVIGVVVIAVSFPISLFFYRVAFGINALGILNGAAAFVIIGIGVDDVFVYMNIYRQADHMKDPVKRIWYTVKTAGVATFFTSFTTAAAFAANIASSIPAVYEFGLFMSLIVSSCWISVFVMMPPTLYLHACWFEPIENFLLSCFSCVGFKGGASTNSSPLHQYNQQQGSEYHLYDEDLPMLNVDVMDNGVSSSNNYGDNGIDDDDMILMDDPNSVSEIWNQPTRESTRGVESNIHMEPVDDSNVCLGLLLQRVMVFFTDKVVIRGRYIVIGFYAAVLIGSCVLMTRLKPSTHPPQLFRPDTNIQQLLDLKANFTIIDTLHCDRCSAIYKVLPSRDDITDNQQYIAPVTQQTRSEPTDPEVDHQNPTKFIYTPSSAQPSQALSPDLATTTSPNWQYNKFDQSFMNLGNQTQYVPLEAMALGVYKIFSQWLSSPDKEGSLSTSHYVPAVSTEIPAVRTRVPTVMPTQVPSTKQPPHHENVGVPQTTQVSPQIPDGAHQQSNQQSPPAGKSSSSVEENYNACKGQVCNNLKDRPLIESGATVYVVFGIKGVDRSQEDVGHVLDQFKGTTIFDPKFAETFILDLHDQPHLRELCAVCNIIANRTDLVKKGSVQCLPSGMNFLHTMLGKLEECRNLPGFLSGNQQSTVRAEGGIDHLGRLLWLAFAFESTTSEGQAYFEAYKQFEKWEKLILDIKSKFLSADSPLKNMFQTSEFWPKVMMEVVAVNSALYGLVLSMIICVMAVAVFTGHITLLLIVVVTIIAMICCVVGVFALAGWEMGAVEAVSLSILVGSSVDYCVHIVEGFILAGKRMPEQYMKSQAAADIRKQRTSQAVRHIGVAIVCSALTTIIAAIPLTQTYIQPFAKFGSILLINTTISMVMTLTLAVALMAMFGPAYYKGGWKAHLIAFGVVTGVIGASILGLYIAAIKGVSIPGPSGNPLFS